MAAINAYGHDWRKFGQKVGEATALVIIGEESQTAFANGFYVIDEASMIGLTDAPKVKIELFYESECPGCKQAITTSFKKAMATEGFEDMAEVSLYPYGNAHETEQPDGTWSFSCQHGVTECNWNMVEACVQDVACGCQFKVLECMEESLSSSGGYEELVGKCAADAPCTPDLADQVKACTADYGFAASSKGNALHHAIAVKTEALNPPHKYVPWVVADGQHTEEINDEVTSDLLGYVCKHFTGEKAAACNSLEEVNQAVPEKCYFEPETTFLQ